jgi:hypothetical protein
MYPTMTKESKEEYGQYLYDSSLSQDDMDARNEFRRKLEEKAKAEIKYTPPVACFEFFKSRHRSVNHGRR